MLYTTGKKTVNVPKSKIYIERENTEKNIQKSNHKRIVK